MTAPARPRSFTVDGDEYVGLPADEFPECDLSVTDEDITELFGEHPLGITRSQNGWVANDRSLIVTYVIPGTVRKMALRKGDAGFVLCHFLAWFDKNIESIDHDGELDDWGYAERKVRGSSTTVSNHASGTAGDVNAPEHPLGKRNTFTATQRGKIRAQLALYEGCVRWGGDYDSRPDDMHFELNAGPSEVSRIARKLRKSDTKPVRKPGSRTLGFSNPRMSGADVVWLQKKLNSLGNKLVVNGIYDMETAAVATKYKENRDINEPGVGKLTWSKLLA